MIKILDHPKNELGKTQALSFVFIHFASQNYGGEMLKDKVLTLDQQFKRVIMDVLVTNFDAFRIAHGFQYEEAATVVLPYEQLSKLSEYIVDQMQKQPYNPMPVLSALTEPDVVTSIKDLMMSKKDEPKPIFRGVYLQGKMLIETAREWKEKLERSLEENIPLCTIQ